MIFGSSARPMGSTCSPEVGSISTFSDLANCLINQWWCSLVCSFSLYDKQRIRATDTTTFVMLIITTIIDGISPIRRLDPHSMGCHRSAFLPIIIIHQITSIYNVLLLAVKVTASWASQCDTSELLLLSDVVSFLVLLTLSEVRVSYGCSSSWLVAFSQVALSLVKLIS